MPDRGSRRSWCGAGVSFGRLPRLDLRRAGRRRWDQRRVLRQRLLRRLLGRLGELHGPGALLAGVDLEKAGAVIAARQTILDALDGELLVARAHEGLAGPFAAAVVVDGENVIEARDQRPLYQRLAAACGEIPPALRRPAFGILVADGDADPAPGIVAEAEVRRRRSRETDHCKRKGGPERRS